MSHLRVVRFLSGAVVAAALAFLPSCGSNDKEPLLLIEASFSNAGNATAMDVRVDVETRTVAQQRYAVPTASPAKLGIFLPSGTTGSATVVVSLVDASGCVLAMGANSVAITSSDTTGPVALTLSAKGPCSAGGSDGGTASLDGGVDQTSTDAGQVGLDGALVSVDVPAKTEDGSSAMAETAVDTVTATVDTVAAVDAPSDPLSPGDAPMPDSYSGSDASTADASTTMNVFANCAQYTHSIPGPDGGPQDWGIRQFAFSPDGKHLVAFGEDSRAKLWAVGATALADTGIVFAGGRNSVYGAISGDGKYVAVGDGDGNVNVYDLPASIEFHTPSLKWNLSTDLLPEKPYDSSLLQFTTDGNHLVVVYGGDNFGPISNQVVVWDLATQKPVRTVKYDYTERPLAILAGDYAGAMWVATAKNISTDAGTDQSTLSLMDVAQANPAKAQVAIADHIYKTVFSPDGAALAIAFDSGEVSLWDITNKANIARLGNPLVAKASGLGAYSVAYSKDGNYVAAGVGYFYGQSNVSLTRVQQRLSLQKGVTYLPWSVAFAPDGLALAIGERDYGTMLYCRP